MSHKRPYQTNIRGDSMEEWWRRGNIPSALTVHPCQLHEYLSDQDACSTLNSALDEFYELRVSDLDLVERFICGSRARRFETK